MLNKTIAIAANTFQSNKLKTMEQETKELKRSFGGKTTGFIDKLNDQGDIIQTWKEERNIEQKHLRAYLKGRTKFRIGFNSKGESVYVNVKEIWS